MDEQTSIFNVSPENFQTEVIDRSQQVPVLLLFWADQVPPSAETKQLLKRWLANIRARCCSGWWTSLRIKA